MKVGIFGGSFNPPHMGHIACLTSVQKKAGLDLIRVVPTFQSPLKHLSTDQLLNSDLK